MVLVPLYSPPPTLLPISRKSSPILPVPSLHRRPRGALLPRAVGTPPTPNLPGFRSQNQNQKVRTLFPGGFKRAEIKVPTLVLSVAAGEVVGNERSRSAIEASVAGGSVGILLLSGGGGGAEGGLLYEAACSLKALIRDRAYLVIEERVDIAAAVGANGVLLSDQDGSRIQ